MGKRSSYNTPSYGMEAIISTIANEEKLLEAFRIECENQRKNLNHLNEQTSKLVNISKRKNRNIIKLPAVSNISMD
jgi:aspartate/tyrosine/aromatic aminotransferase